MGNMDKTQPASRDWGLENEHIPVDFAAYQFPV